MGLKMNQRERVLMGILVALLVALAYYHLVFVPTSAQISQLDQQISDVRAQVDEQNIRALSMEQMKRQIATWQEQGRHAQAVPAYDNGPALTAAINAAMEGSDVYDLSIEVEDPTASENSGSGQSANTSATDRTLVHRTVTLSFGCESYEQARSVINAICDGAYPCAIDECSITANTLAARLQSARANAAGSGGSTTDAYSVRLKAVFLEHAQGEKGEQ
ncbi:MAG: hypothetical protein ACOX4F_01700 [Atopobiaceae bacterium]|jgi:cell division protein FtsB